MFYLLLVIFGALMLASADTNLASKPVGSVQTVYEFPNNTFVENLAVRANGQILVTVLTSTELVLIDPSHPGRAVPVYNFTEAHGLAGIVEYQPDVFAVLAGDYHYGTQNFGQGTWTFWRVDLRGVKVANDYKTLKRQPVVTEIQKIPDGQLLNGLTVGPGSDRYLLAGDTLAGVIWSLDTSTGEYKVAINSTLLSKLDTPHGVNGIHVFGDNLYFANSGQDTLVKVRVNEDGTAAGPFTIIANATSPHVEYDDFTVDSHGNIFAATEGANTILKILPDGSRQTIIAGSLNSTIVAEPTSAAFGRGAFDNDILYVTTAGGMAIPVNGHIIIPGKLLAVKTDSKGYYS